MMHFNQNLIRLANPHRATGFTLVEVMVGLLIGLIVTIVIFQVFEVSERQKRTTVGTSDAQGNGAIAMNMLGQSVRSSGVGLDHRLFGNCTTLRANTSGTSGAAANAQLASSLFSVASITDGGDAPDSISVLYYLPPNTDISNVRYATTMLAGDMSSPDAPAITTRTMWNCEAPPALALMVQDGDCMLMTVTAASTATTSEAVITKGVGTNFNFPAGTAIPPGFLFEKNKASVQCFPGLYRATWSINDQQLEVVNEDLLSNNVLGNSFTARGVIPVMSNIVHMKAQYGVLGGTGAIQWVSATDEWTAGESSGLGITAASDLAHIRRIRAIRVAMLARNEEYQKPDATGTCDATTSAQTGDWPSWASFSTEYLAEQDPDWNCYRYKAFESTIPIRNILWAN